MDGIDRALTAGEALADEGFKLAEQTRQALDMYDAMVRHRDALREDYDTVLAALKALIQSYENDAGDSSPALEQAKAAIERTE